MIWRLGNSIRFEISNRFAALENISDGEEINRAWKNIKENTTTSAKENLVLQELMQHKPCFDEECLHFLDQRKQAKFSQYRIEAKAM